MRRFVCWQGVFTTTMNVPLLNRTEAMAVMKEVPIYTSRLVKVASTVASTVACTVGCRVGEGTPEASGRV